MAALASDDPFTDPNSPASKLKQIGYPAIPALIDALPSRYLTRGYSRPRGVLRVGDLSLKILQGISCKEWAPPDAGQRDQRSAAAPELEAEIRDWWKHAQPAGERKTLISQLGEGGRTGFLSAERLVKGYPGDAVLPIVKAIDTTTIDGDRAALVTALSELHGGPAEQAMKREIGRLPDTNSRFIAARYLARSAPDEALSAAITISKQMRAGSQRASASLVQSVQAFLAESGRAEAIAAMGQGLATAVPSERFRVIVQLNGDPYKSSGRSAGLPLPKVPQDRQRYELAVESLLAGELGDSRRYAESAEPRMGGHTSGARAAEPAAAGLAGGHEASLPDGAAAPLTGAAADLAALLR